MEVHCPERNHTTNAPSAPRGLTVAGVLERYLRPFLAEYGDQVSPHQLRVLGKLIDCQTPRAGTHAWRCRHCGHHSVSNNWCGDRHCLHCYVKHRMDWLDQVKACTLPCVYLHIVFTLPHEFHALVAANRVLLYNLLFGCAIGTLLRQMRREFGLIPSITGALHTWGSVLLEHFHTHNVMSCGGLSLDGTDWIDCDPHDPRLSRQALAPKYRERFLKKLNKLYGRGKLVMPPSMTHVDSMSAFEAWLAPIAAKDWMVNVQPPPPDCDGPATALGYLGRYVAGTCIGDTRIVDDDGTHITIRVKNYRKQGREETRRLTGVEFVRRFALHILPRGFRRIRHAGLLTQRRRKEYLARCRELLKDRMPKQVQSEPPVADGGAEDAARCEDTEERGETELTPPRRCPRCLGTDFEFIECYEPDRPTARSRAAP